MLCTELSTIIHAPQSDVIAAYRDYRRWPQIFPAVYGVRAVRRESGRQTLAIDHREGLVVNVLTDVAPDTIELQEWKGRYTATFLNRFQAIPDGTRYTLRAEIRLRGAYRVFAPFVRWYARRQMARLVLRPLKAALEHRGDAPAWRGSNG